MLEDEDHVYFFLRKQAVEYKYKVKNFMLLIKTKVDVIDVLHSDQVTGSFISLSHFVCFVVLFVFSLYVGLFVWNFVV